MFIKLMSLSPLQRMHGTESVLQPEIGLLGGNDPNISHIHERLRTSGFKNVRLLQPAEFKGLYMALDIIVDVAGSLHAADPVDIDEKTLRRTLLPGGLLITAVSSAQKVGVSFTSLPLN
jgi:hypothetical protein